MRYQGSQVLTEGYRLVPETFGIGEARELKDIIDKHGHVYDPNPYDIPKQPLKVLAFSLKFVLAIIDTGMIGAGDRELFVTKEELIAYAEKTLELLRAVENPAITGQHIEYQRDNESSA